VAMGWQGCFAIVTALLLTACPLPCSKGTHTNGGDQCVARPELSPLSALRNDTGAPLTVVVSQINERACDRKVRPLDDTSTESSVDPHAQPTTLAIGERVSSRIGSCVHVRLTSGEHVSRYYLQLDGTEYPVRRGPDGRPEIQDVPPATDTARRAP